MRLPPWHAHPTVWLVLGSVAVGYVLWCRRHRRETGEATSPHQARLFLGGMATLWIGADWPIHDLAERYLYSVHMVQHLLFTLVAAPLLLSGMPAWMLRAIIRPRPVGAVARLATRPVVALALFNGALLFIHWPAIVELSVRSEWAHFGLHVLI